MDKMGGWHGRGDLGLTGVGCRREGWRYPDDGHPLFAGTFTDISLGDVTLRNDFLTSVLVMFDCVLGFRLGTLFGGNEATRRRSTIYLTDKRLMSRRIWV
jgi:hypothetical protein